MLGRLNPNYFLAGKMRLNTARAHQKLAELGATLGMTVEETAQAVIEMANENMANAIRVVSIDRGLDARDFTLVAFGGAGPLHASGIVRRVGMKRIVVPLYPGLCSAFGSLIADFQVDKVWSKHFRSDRVDVGVVRKHFDELVSEAVREIYAEGFFGDPEVERTISMRYAGQNYEHDVRVEDGEITAGSLNEAFEEFHRLHERFYGYSIGYEVIELIRFNVKVVGRTDNPQLKAVATSGEPRPRETRQVYFKEQGFVECPVYRREDLRAGFTWEGPALVEEADSMVLAHPGDRLRIDDHGVITMDV